MFLSPSLSAGSERRHETALTLTRDGCSKQVAFQHAMLQLARSLMKTFLPVLLLSRSRLIHVHVSLDGFSPAEDGATPL